MDIKVEGFSQRLPLLAEAVVRALRELAPEAAGWQRVREGLLRDYRNANLKPAKHAAYLRLLALKHHQWTCEQVLHVNLLHPFRPGSAQSNVPCML